MYHNNNNYVLIAAGNFFSPEQMLNTSRDSYGARMTRGQNQARRRVLLFLTVFLINGFFSQYHAITAVVIRDER